MTHSHFTYGDKNAYLTRLEMVDKMYKKQQQTLATLSKCSVKVVVIPQPSPPAQS